ncbi:MAG: hypothetical protein ACLSH3_07755 [Alistipes finegoldii]
MATKKDIQKNDRKGTGAGLAAGMESENKAPKTEKQNMKNIYHAFGRIRPMKR